MPLWLIYAMQHNPFTCFAFLPSQQGFSSIQIWIFDIAHGEFVYNDSGYFNKATVYQSNVSGFTR
jgi:hypothetical protein